MMKLAESDQPVRKTGYYWGGTSFYEVYQYGLYMRCQILDGLLKVAFFFPQHMRAGGRMPAYELYVDKAAGKFLTYDRGLGRWLKAKLDMLPWPYSVCRSEKKWMSRQGDKLVRDYLGVEHGGYKGLLEYQLKVRADELKQRHKRETDPWDLDLEQTPDLPKDWERWVKKWASRRTTFSTSTTGKGQRQGTVPSVKKMWGSGSLAITRPDAVRAAAMRSHSRHWGKPARS
jgi:hypothetical protein